MGFVLFLMAAILCGSVFAAHAADAPQDPLEALQKTTIVPKDRIVITYMDKDNNMISFRGQDVEIGVTADTSSAGSLSGYFNNTDAKMKTTPGNLGLDGTDFATRFHSPYVMASAGGTVLREVSADKGITFYGDDTFHDVPTGVLCNAYLTKKDSDGEKTSLWLELTGKDGRIGQVELTGAPKPVYKYRTDTGIGRAYTPELSHNVATDLAASDWNGDGYSDYILTYMYNPKGNNNYAEDMRVALLYIDGKSLYDRISTGTGSVLYSADTSMKCSDKTNFWEGVYTEAGDASNSIRTATGDVDGDGADELALVYTRMGGNINDNGVHVLDVAWNGGRATYTKLYSATSDVGGSFEKNDSVGVAIGNLDGDAGGTAEVCVIHGNSEGWTWDTRSPIFLDIYQYGYTEGSNQMKKVVEGVELARGYDNNHHPAKGVSTAPIEVVADDFDGDGRDELAWLTIDEDDDLELSLYIHKWSGDSVSGKGTMKEYNVSDMGGWTLDELFLKFSMTAGIFNYPTSDPVVNTPRHLAIAHMGGSSAKSNTTRNLDWGVFSWNASDGLTLVGKGLVQDVQKRDNVAPKIVAANLDNEGFVLGEPTSISVTNNIELVVAMQAPPKHWDIISGDFNGNRDASGNSVVDVFANLPGYNTTFNSENSSQTIKVTGTSNNFSIGGSVGYTVAVISPFKDAVPLFDVALKYTYNSVKQNTASETRTATLTQMTAAQKDDQLYYTANDYTIWRYPILFPLEYRTEVVSDDEGNDATVQAFVQYVIPEKIGSSGLSTPGREVAWYEPEHDTLNLFTYPRNIQSIQNYPKGKMKDPNDPWINLNGISLAEMNEQVIGNPDVSNVNMTIREDISDSELESRSHTAGGNMSGGIPLGIVPPTGGIGQVIKLSLASDYSYQSSVTSTTNSTQMNGATVNWPGVGSYANRGGFDTADQMFKSDFAIFTQDAGAFHVAYAVSTLKNERSDIWGASSPYSKTPDPGFVLPHRFTYEREINTKPDALIVRGLTFDADSYMFDKAGAAGKALPMDTEVTGTVRVVNYSFFDTEDFKVEVSYQPVAISAAGYVDAPDASKAKPIDGSALDVKSIVGREREGRPNDNNWKDVEFKWKTGKALGLGYLHFKIVYGGKELSAANNRGYALVGVYDPADMEALEEIGGARAAMLRASGAWASDIDADLFIKSVTVRDAQGREMAGLDALPVDQAMEIECVVGLVSKKSDGIRGLPLVRTLLLANDGIAGGKYVPLLPMGKDWTFTFNYEPSIHSSLANLKELRLVATSPFLPFEGDADSSNNTYKMSFASAPGSSGGGGCNAAGMAVPAIFATLAACLAVAKRRR